MKASENVLLPVIVTSVSQACTPQVHATAPAPVTAHTTPRETYFAGKIVRVNGSPAGGAVVVVSDLNGGDQLTTQRVDTNGAFVTKLRPGRYALTATDEQESAYMATLDGSDGPVEVRLDPNCHRFVGRLQTVSPIPPDALVQLARVSDLVGDQFAAAVSDDGSFKACIPAAEYLVYPPQGFVFRDARVVVPYTGVFEYRTDSTVDADRLPADMSGIAPRTRDQFAAALPASVRVLGLGESNHGTREFYDERAALAIHLAAVHGQRWIVMLEAGYGEVIKLDEYVNGASIDIGAAVHDLGYWMWDTRTFLHSLADIREFNRRVPRQQRIRLVGIDVQDTSGAIEYLEQQRPAALSADQRKALAPLAINDGKGWKTLEPAQRASIRAAVEKLADASAPRDAFSSQGRAVLAARSLLLRLDVLEAANPRVAAEMRDAGMSRMVLDVLAMEPVSRATVWAHIGHLAREQVLGIKTMGGRLAAALGDRYQVYGLLALAGSARAWDSKMEIGVISKQLSQAAPQSVEAVLAPRPPERGTAYWTFASATGEAAEWLTGIHKLREFGSIFMREEQEFAYWDLRALDGVIVFDKVTPTDPTPTGDRRAKPKVPVNTPASTTAPPP